MRRSSREEQGLGVVHRQGAVGRVLCPLWVHQTQRISACPVIFRVCAR